MAVIQTDTRQQMNKKHHQEKEQYFIQQGHKVLHSKLAVGDYAVPGNGSVVVDTKQHCSELYQDLIQDHDRFHRECVLAQECGIKLYVLIESAEGFTKIDDLRNWKNPQMLRYFKIKKMCEREGRKAPKPPASNVQLIKIMHSMHRDYGVEFVFVPQKQAGAKVLELLGVTT